MEKLEMNSENFTRCDRKVMRLATLQAIWKHFAVYTEFVPPGQTANKVFFIKTSLKVPEKGSFASDQTLQTNGCPIMTTPYVTLHSPSQNCWPQKHSYGSPVPLFTWPTPCDVLLFPTFKNILKGRYFGTLENIQKSAMNMLKIISVEDFQRCYQKWEQSLHRCVAAQGNYIDVWKKYKLW